MKRFISIPVAILMMTSNQASTILTNGDHYMETNPYVAQAQTVTPNVQARAKSKRIDKSKVVNLKVQRFLDIDDDDDIFVEQEDLATGYRRRDLTKIEHEDGISEKVRWRLFLARQMAMLKYRELHG